MVAETTEAAERMCSCAAHEHQYAADETVARCIQDGCDCQNELLIGEPVAVAPELEADAADESAPEADAAGDEDTAADAEAATPMPPL